MPAERAIGDTFVSTNGYHYTKQDTGKWRLTHHIIAGERLGRDVDTSQERVVFIDGDKTNLDPDNIKVVAKKTTKAKRIAALRDKLILVEEELAALENREPREL